MKNTLAIIGAGDLGHQIAHYALSDHHYTKVVFLDDFQEIKTQLGYQIIGKISETEDLYKKNAFDEVIIGFGYKHLKTKELLFEKLASANIPFGKIIHSSSWIDPTAIIEEGTVIYPSCSIDAQSKIEKNTVLNIACTVAHDTTIGAHSFLSPRVAIAGFVNIGNRCILGINSTIIDNITITNDVQLGGGTVVISNIDNAGLYVGNPQRFIR